MSDIYQAPTSQLTESTSLEGFGSLEKGQAGDYEFSVRAIISEAWDKTKGYKGTVWLTMLFYMIVFLPVVIGIPFLLQMIGLPSGPQPGQQMGGTVVVGMLLSQVIIVAATLPLGAGFFMIGLKRAVGANASATEVFDHYGKTLSLFATMVLMYIMIAIGFILFVIPGIYLMFAYYLAIPLVVEKGLSPWQALEASRKAISKRWFRFVGFGLVLGLICSISMIPLGIGLIWTLPLMIIGYGIVYRNIFGYEGEVSA